LYTPMDAGDAAPAPEQRTARGGVSRGRPGPEAPEGHPGRGSRGRQEAAMTTSPFRIALATVLALSSARLLAHHSFSAEFDENRPVKVTGTVTMMRWSNPHAWI